MSRYFNAGIQVPIVIFADPTGREIAGTRLDHVQAQVKATYLEHAKKALETFRGGQDAGKAREQWAALGKAFRLRTEAKDSGAGIELLQRLRDGAAKGSQIQVSADDYLRRVDAEEAAGLLQVGEMDLRGGDLKTGLDELYQLTREFPGLPSARKAADIIAKARTDPATTADAGRAKEAADAEREHLAAVALRAADRLARDGKRKEAAEAWAKVAKDYDGTPAAGEARERR